MTLLAAQFGPDARQVQIRQAKAEGRLDGFGGDLLLILAIGAFNHDTTQLLRHREPPGACNACMHNSRRDRAGSSLSGDLRSGLRARARSGCRASWRSQAKLDDPLGRETLPNPPLFLNSGMEGDWERHPPKRVRAAALIASANSHPASTLSAFPHKIRSFTSADSLHAAMNASGSRSPTG